MNEFFYNIMYRASDSVKKLETEIEFDKKNCVVISDEHDIAYHLAGTFAMLNCATADVTAHLIVDKVPVDEARMQDFMDNFESVHIWTSIDDYLDAKKNTLDEVEDEEHTPWQQKSDIYVNLVNLRLPVFASAGDERNAAYDKKTKELERLVDIVSADEESKLQIITCIPSIDEPLPDVLHAVAEREYEVVYRDKPEDSPEKYTLKIEEMIRSNEISRDRTQIIRLDRVFGPGIYSNDGSCINDVFRDFAEKKELTIYDNDRYDFFSVSFVGDAVFTIVLALAGGRMGNIYNVSSWEISRYQIISNIFDLFPQEKINLETVHDDEEHTITYRMLNSKKSELVYFKNISKKIRTPKPNAILDTGYWFIDEKDYIPRSDINVYYGRMDRIREIELEILKEVDKICKENNINYFLAAGTMLGAVRHKGFIPWDDDVDIGMLPEDYAKFIKVCPNSLSVDIGYQNALEAENCHYIHDKIRLKNSFFSTKYSDRYNMLNGVYIDVFLYYKTANSPKAQERHIRKVRTARNLLGIRWADRKYQKGRFYRLCWDISHKLPDIWFDKYYRRVCMKYDKKNTNYRIDGGFNLEKAGAVPDEWFHGTVDATFCGYTFPILEHYDDFLTHWYSSHYMELLPVDGRKSVHDVVRIDIGQNLFDETKNDPRFRDVDLRGELYEENKIK